MSADDYSSGWHMESDELVRRLSKLEWAPVSEELRERCWMDFEDRVAQNGNGRAEAARSRAAFNVGERYDMRRFAPAGRMAVAAPRRSLVASTRLAAATAGRAHIPRRALSLG